MITKTTQYDVIKKSNEMFIDLFLMKLSMKLADMLNDEQIDKVVKKLEEISDELDNLKNKLNFTTKNQDEFFENLQKLSNFLSQKIREILITDLPNFDDLMIKIWDEQLKELKLTK